jgi:hypothetical protein
MSTKQFISTIFAAECVAGNAMDIGLLTVDVLLSAIEPDRLESVLKEVIDLTHIDLGELKSQLDSLTIDSTFPCSTTISHHDIVVNELVKDIHLNKVPYAGVNSFLLTVEYHQTEKFLKRVDMSYLNNYMLSMADFGEDNTVNQTGDLTTETSSDEFRSDQTLFWNGNNDELDDDVDDIRGSFNVYLSRDGLSCAAGADGNDVDILNYDEVITSAAKHLKIPESLVSQQ